MTIDRIQAAAERIRSIKGGAMITPLRFSGALSELTRCHVYLKCEHLQHTGSFKFRGALNKLSLLRGKTNWVTAASTGNHGLGVARAARLLGMKARIFVPENASPIKLAHIRRLGAQLEQIHGDCLVAELAARRTAESEGGVFVSPYNDPDVIDGQGTVGLELAEQLPDVDAVFVSVGGGGLIGGIGTSLKTHRPDIQVVGCWAENSPVMYQCMDSGSIVKVTEKETLSDGTAGNLEPGSITLPVCQTVIDHRILVSEEEIKAALKLLAAHERWMVEGAAAVATAACLKEAEAFRGKKIAIVLCGRNIALEKFMNAVR